MKGSWTALAAWGLLGSAKGDFLNEYLFDKTFGAIPGPCPTFDERCTGRWDTLPQTVKDISVCLFGNLCAPIGSVLKGGLFEIWQLECKNINIVDVKLDSIKDGPTELENDVFLKDFGLACKFMTNVIELKASVADQFGLILTTRNAGLKFPNSGTRGVVNADLNLHLYPDTAKGQSFSNDLPFKVTLPADECSVGVGLGLDLTLEQIDELWLCAKVPLFVPKFNPDTKEGCFQVIGAGNSGVVGALLRLFNIDGILSFVVRILEAVIGGIICSIISEFAVLRDGRNGVVNDLLQSVKSQVDTEASRVGPNDLDPVAADLNVTNKVSPTELLNSYNLGDSTVLEAISVGLNSWLGNPSSTPGFTGLVINELINSVTDPDGYFMLDLVDAGFAPEVTNLPLKVSDVTVRLEKFALAGANTIDQFQILQNAFNPSKPADRLDYTVQNKLKINEVGFDVTIFTKLAKGEWVTKGSASSQFTFTFSMTLSELFFDAFTLILWDFKRIQDVKVGQLTGLTVDTSGSLSSIQAQIEDSVQCVAPALYLFEFTDLEASLGAVTKAQMKDFSGNGLSSLIESAVQLGAAALKGALKAKLPGLSRGVIREKLNEVIVKYITGPGRAGTNRCPSWKGPVGATDVPLNFKSGLFAGVGDLVQKSVGGNPVKDTTFDINDLVDTLVTYFSANYKQVPIRKLSGVAQGQWELKPDYRSMLKATAYQRPADYIQLSNLLLKNVNSIYKLLVISQPEVGQYGALGIELGLGGEFLGKPTPKTPLTIELPFSVVSNGGSLPVRTSETFTLTLEISQLVFNTALTGLYLDLDFLNGLSLGQATGDLQCLAGVPSFLSFQEDNKLSITDVKFLVTNRVSNNLQSGLNKALTALVASGTSISPRSNRLLNTVIRNSLTFGLRTVEKLPASYDKYLTPANCSSAVNPLSALTDLFNVPLPNLTAFVETCTAEPNFEKPAVGEFEEQAVYTRGQGGDATVDFKESAVVPFISGFVDKAFAEGGADALLKNFANQTGSLLAQIFRLDPTNKDLVDVVLPLGDLGLALSNDDIIPGLVLSIGDVTLFGANKLLRYIQALKPIGKHTTSSRLDFVPPAGQSAALKVEINAFVEMDKSAVDGPGAVGKVKEQVKIALDVTNFLLSVDLMTAINMTSLGEKSLGHFFRMDAAQTVFINSDTFAACAVDIFFANGLGLRQVNLNVGSISRISVTSVKNEILTKEMSAVFQAVTELVVDFYKDAARPIAQNCVRTFINDNIREFQKNAKCPKYEEVTPPPLKNQDALFRFNTSADMATFQGLWQDYVLDNDYVNLNAVVAGSIGQATFFETETNNQLEFNSTVAYLGTTYGDIDLKLANVQLRDLVFSKLLVAKPFTIGDVPQKKRMLVTSKNGDLTPENVGYSTRTQVTIPGTMSIEVDLTLNAKGLFQEIPDMKNRFSVALKLTGLSFSLDLLSKLNATELLALQLKSLTDFSQLPCLLVPIKELRPLDFGLSLTGISVEVGCITQCDLPFLKNLGTISFESQNREEIAKLLDQGLTFAIDYLHQIEAQKFVDDYLATADVTCAELLGLINQFFSAPLIEYGDVASVMGYGIAGLVTVVVMSYTLVYPVHVNRRKQALVNNLSNSEKQIETMSQAESTKAMAQIMYATEMSIKSIFTNPKTPVLAKFLFPMACVINLGLLLIATVFTDAMSLTVKVMLLGADTVYWEIVPISVSSLINTMSEELSIVVGFVLALALGVIPLVQSLTLLAVWFTPGTVLKSSTRQNVIVGLEMTGKIGFILVFIVAVLAAALYTVINLKDYEYTTFLPEDLLVIELNVLPKTGMLWLGLGSMINLVMAHLASWYNQMQSNLAKKAQDIAKGLRREEGDMQEAKAASARKRFIEHSFLGVDRSGNSRRVNDKRMLAVVGIAGFALLALFIAVFLPTITIEVTGVAGVLLKTISTDSPTLETPLQLKTFSLFQIGAALSTTPKVSAIQAFGVFLFQLLYFCVFILAPLSSLAVLIFLTIAPLRLKAARLLFWFQGICIYWSSIDLAFTVCVASLILINPIILIYINYVSGVIISNDFCESIEPVLKGLGFEEKNQNCMSVNVSLEYGIAFLFIGVSGLLASNIVFRIVGKAIVSDRYFAAFSNVRSDATPKKFSKFGLFLLSKFTVSQPAQAGAHHGPSVFDEADEDDNKNGEGFCSGFCSYWSSSKAQAQRSKEVDTRIDAWRQRFTEASSGPSNDNPIYGGRNPLDSFASSASASGRLPSRAAPRAPASTKTSKRPGSIEV